MSSNRNAGNREESEPFAGPETVETTASGIPGVSGRPMNRRRDEVDVEADAVAEWPILGGSSGGTRSAKLLQKNRKNKRAA